MLFAASFPNQIPSASRANVGALRRKRYTGRQIALELGISAPPSAASCKGWGLNKVKALEPCEAVRPYGRERRGEMIHLDIKKLGRINGIGHHNRSSTRTKQRAVPRRRAALGVRPSRHRRHLHRLRQGHPSEKKRSATAFLRAALACYQSLGIKVERVMTDNSSFYKSFTFRNLCKRLGLKHIRTKPYTPRTNGKAERFIQTCCGVGLRAGLPPLTTENRTASQLAAPLQLVQTSCRYRW